MTTIKKWIIDIFLLIILGPMSDKFIKVPDVSNFSGIM